VRLGTAKTAGPAGMEPVLRLDMLNADEMVGQGVSLMPTATPPSVSSGLLLNGSTQYARILLAHYTAAFEGGGSDEVSIYEEFAPDANYTEVAGRAFWDGAAPNRYLAAKSGVGPTFPIVFYAGATTAVGSIDAAVYGAYWRTGARNRICATMKSGANAFYFNGVQIGTDPAAWSRVLPDVIDVGASASAGANYFAGTIYDFRVYSRKLTAAEAIELTTVP
jgi:hypothetical protein